MVKIIPIIIAIILMIPGLFYLVIPHSVHLSSNLDFGLSHIIHMGIGISLIAIALFLGFFGLRK